MMLNSLYDKDQVYYSELDNFCFESCVRQVLEGNSKHNVSVILNYSMGFILYEDRNHIMIESEQDYSSILPTYSEYFHYYEESRVDYDKVWKENVLCLEKGNALIVGVDTFYLPYLPYFKKSHGKHAIIIAGYDKEKEEVYVIDWFSQWKYKGKFSASILHESRENFDYGVKRMYPWAYLDPLTNELDLKVAIAENICLTIKQYYTKGKELQGIFALEHIYNKLIKQQDNYHELKEYFSQLSVQLKYVASRKNMFSLFLKEASYICESETITRCYQLLLVDAKYWKRLLFLLMRGTFRVETSITQIIEQLAEIIKVEYSIRNELVDYYDSCIG